MASASAASRTRYRRAPWRKHTTPLMYEMMGCSDATLWSFFMRFATSNASFHTVRHAMGFKARRDVSPCALLHSFCISANNLVFMGNDVRLCTTTS